MFYDDTPLIARILGPSREMKIEEEEHEKLFKEDCDMRDEDNE
jgi:hypothetical protein